MGDFAHLHLHTQYSLLDGAIRLDELFPKVLAHKMKSVAMTDHGNLFGAVDFYEKAQKYGVKPIFGCETYVATDRRDKTERKNHHLILLARDNVGWKNLSYLNSMGFLEGFHFKPRIDKALLREHAEGLTGLSACLGGEVAQALMRKGPEAGEAVAQEYQSIFGKGNFFLELQPNGLAEQETVNGQLLEIAKKTGIPVVATNDCHYLERRHHKAHNVLMAIQLRKTINDPSGLHHRNDAYYVKSPAEMESYFQHIPEAMENAARIARLCNVELDLGTQHLPRFDVPGGMGPDDYVTRLAREGLTVRLTELRRRGGKPDEDAYRQRLDYELDVIRSMQFSVYFLIVWDFIRHARERFIPVGPGRGSGAGSLVAYALAITNLDPITHKLLFERFLNPERKSMPDVDVDFCMDRREEVIAYVREKYGKDNVGQIVTMHQMKSRIAIRDVARAMAVPYAEAVALAKLVPEAKQGIPPTIDEALRDEPRFREQYEGNERTREVIDIARTLENLNRHAGKHAAGVVIGEKPLWEYVPCCTIREKDSKDRDLIVTQFNMNDVAKAGLIKFDFLGLTTLTVIQKALDLVNAERSRHGDPPLDLEDLDTGDPEVYRLLASGDMTGIFQMESSGFRELVRKLRPDCFEHIIAAGALFRPGPLGGGAVEQFVECRHGRRKVVYPHPIVESILKDTYGVIVYQEQVMQIAVVMAGYPMAKADELRSAMGKKKKDVIGRHRQVFAEGAHAKGISPDVVTQVFDNMEKFGEYGFNRSHSAAYGLITYRTAFLKRYHRVEFLAALLSCSKDDTDKVVKFIAEARAKGIEIRRPDVNESDADFTVERSESAKSAIRFGLAAVKGLGEGAAAAIRETRSGGAPFRSLFDFCNRVNPHGINRKALEALVKAGAFDSVESANGVSRARIFAAIDLALDRAAKTRRDADSGQTSLLGLFGAAGIVTGSAGHAPGPDDRGATYPQASDWPPRDALTYERESLGFYISGHPLDRFGSEVRRYASATTATCHDARNGGEVTIGGVVCDFQERTSKSGKKYGMFKLEDQLGQVEFHVFAKKLDAFRKILESTDPLLVTGRPDNQREGDDSERVRLIFEHARPLQDVRSERVRCLVLTLNADDTTEDELVALEKLLREHHGTCSVEVHMVIKGRSRTILDLDERGERYKVEPGDALLDAVEALLGRGMATFR